MFTLVLSHPEPRPHPLCKALSTSIMQPFITSKQNMSLPPILNTTPSARTHVQGKGFQAMLVKEGAQRKGHRGNSLKDCNVC